MTIYLNIKPMSIGTADVGNPRLPTCTSGCNRLRPAITVRPSYAIIVLRFGDVAETDPATRISAWAYAAAYCGPVHMETFLAGSRCRRWCSFCWTPFPGATLRLAVPVHGVGADCRGPAGHHPLGYRLDGPLAARVRPLG